MNAGAPFVAGLGGVLLFLAAGRGLVELLPALRERPLAARLAWSYVLGVAAVAGSTYLLGVAFDVRIRRGVVLAPAVALVAAGLLARFLRGGAPRILSLRPPRAGILAARAAFGIGAVIAAGLFAAALTQANMGWDGEMTWSAAARWVRADRSVAPRALTDPRIFVWHPRYPLLLPLAQVAVQETFDSGDDRRAVKPLYAAFFPALVLVLFDVARRHAGTCAAALAAVGVAAVPALVSDFGGADGTYSDVPLAAFFGGGFLLLLGRPRRSEGVAAALLLGAAVLTKNEGLPFALAALAAAGFLAFFSRPAERRRRFALLVVVGAGVFASAAATSVWRARIPARWDEDYVGRLGKVSLLAEARARLPLMPAAVARETTDRDQSAGFPLACAVVLATGAGGLRRKVVPPLVLCLYLCFAAYTLALLLTTWPGVEQIHPTWNRLLIQLTVPLGVLLALALRTAWRVHFAVSRVAAGRRTEVASPARPVAPAHGFRRGLLVFLAFAVLPVVATWLWAGHRREQVRALEESSAAAATAAKSPASPWREDASLTGGLDEPAEGAFVHGRLEVRGWARVPGQDLHVTVLLDGKPLASGASARTERRDVQGVLPALGDCSSAGYEFTYDFSPERAGAHEIAVLFRSADGRERHYPPRWIRWER